MVDACSPATFDAQEKMAAWPLNEEVEKDLHQEVFQEAIAKALDRSIPEIKTLLEAQLLKPLAESFDVNNDVRPEKRARSSTDA